MPTKRKPVIIRFLSLFLAMTVFVAMLPSLFFGLKGLFVGWLLADVLLFGAIIYSEKGVIANLGKLTAPSSGLNKTFEAAHRELLKLEGGAGGLPPPRLVIYSDPLPHVLSLKGLGSRGSVVMSTGLLTQFDEAELRSIFINALRTLGKPEWVFYSLCTYLTVITFKLTPSEWTQMLFSNQAGRATVPINPLSALRAIVFYPILRLLVSLGEAEWQPLLLDSAAHKLDAAAKRARRNPCPGVFLLSVMNSAPKTHSAKPLP